MTEIDVDAFGGPTFELDPPNAAPDPAVVAAVRAAQDAIPKPEAPAAARSTPSAPVVADLLEAVILRSQHGGPSHVVTVRRVAHVADPVVLCNCEAMNWLDRNPAGCWAMKATRVILKGV